MLGQEGDMKATPIKSITFDTRIDFAFSPRLSTRIRDLQSDEENSAAIGEKLKSKSCIDT